MRAPYTIREGIESLSDARVIRLSPRETAIAQLIADDLPDKVIANRLGISPRTVQGHLDRIGKRLGARRQPIARRRVIARWWLEQREAA